MIEQSPGGTGPHRQGDPFRPTGASSNQRCIAISATCDLLTRGRGIMLHHLPGREPIGVPNLTPPRPTTGVTFQLREFALGFGSDFTNLGSSPGLRLYAATAELRSINRHRESRNEPTQTLQDRVPKASARTCQARRSWASETVQCQGVAGSVGCSDANTLPS